MSFEEKMFDKLNEMHKDLQQRINKVTDEQIPAMNKKFDIIEQRFREDAEEKRILNERTSKNEEDIEQINAKFEDTNQRIYDNARDGKLTNMKISEVESMINENNENLAKENQRTSLMMKEIEKIKNNVRKLSDEVRITNGDKDDQDTEDDKNEKNKKKINKNKETTNKDEHSAEDPKVVEEVMVRDTERRYDEQRENDIARKKVGVWPVTAFDIREANNDNEDIFNATDDELFRDPKFANARCEAAINFLHLELKFNKNDILVVDAYMARDPETKILWIETTELSVKKIFQKAARIRNRDVRILTFFPRHLFNKKRNLDAILRTQRGIDPTLRTQIRLGKSDLELYTKFGNEQFWNKSPLGIYGDPNVDPTLSPPVRRATPSHPSQGKRKVSSPANKDDTTKKHRVTSPANTKQRVTVTVTDPVDENDDPFYPKFCFQGTTE